MPSALSIEALAQQALDGDADAASLLAKQEPCDGFLPFLARFVPEGEMSTDVFDVLSDAYHRMEMEREAAASS